MATAQALQAGRAGEAGQHLQPVLASNPDHAEVLRLLAGIHSLRGDHAAAVHAIDRAVAQRPQDPLYSNTLGTILATAGEYDAAIAAFQRACELQPDHASAWVNLGILLVRCMRNDEAEAALRTAVALAPGNISARVQLADLQRTSNHVDSAAEGYRAIIAERPWTGMAWWGIAELRNGKFSAGDVEQMQSAQRDPNATDDDLISLGFALGRALDDLGRYAEALAALRHANDIARRRMIWDAASFSAEIAALDAAFASPPVAADGDLGAGVVFVVSLPRSGSTLIEQILASHPQVEGAGELPDLPLVIAEECGRRGQALQHWAGAMSAEDWHNLGLRYLQRTARFAQHRPVFVDKMPSNWQYIGAIRAMLPAAHILIARRDPLETSFSCYRQFLNNSEWTRTFDDLASYWRDFDRSAHASLALHRGHVHDVIYEQLVADPENQIRRLLAACGLPFDPACLEFHRTEREVRSPSAMQVRKPLYGDTAHSERYGALLDPLRAALGLPVASRDTANGVNAGG
ncbi:MAG TPA: sulfotransferase [Dokdonella sp.]